MKQSIRLVAAGLAAFLIVLVWRFPARWAMAFLPESVQCSQPDGTLWRGSCAPLAVNGTLVGNVQWDLRPLRLFTGKLSAAIQLSQPAGTFDGIVDISFGGTLTARDAAASITLERLVLPNLPRNVRGTLSAQLDSVSISDRVVTAIQGNVEMRGLEMRAGTPMGDYRVTFPGGGEGEPIGQLTDLGGPLQVQGTLRLTAEPGVVVEGKVAARSTAPPTIARQLQYLGSPDAQGFRPFSFATTY